MRPTVLQSISQSARLQTIPVTRIRRRNFSVLAQQVEHISRTRPEPIQIQLEHPPTRQRPDPHVLVASELAHIRKCMLNLLGSAHPGLAEIADLCFLQPSKQLRSLLVLLFARATNGLGREWDEKDWNATSEGETGRSEEFGQPLSLADTLNEWNPSMPDHTTSFESVFLVQQAVPRPPYPPPRPPRLAPKMSPRLMSPRSILPTQIRLAQIMEMIHVASLLHDGITPTADNTDLIPPNTESQGFGNKLAILGGDFLLGRASWALSRLGESEVVELVASVISNQVEGELLRMDEVKTPVLGPLPGPTKLPEAWELYLRQTYLKTASLMAKGARSAVILGGCQEGDTLREIAYVYGRNLGIAHQLSKDARDMQQMQPGLATGPALFASEECSMLLPLIQRRFTEAGDVQLAVEYIQSTSGVERTQRLATAYAEKAREVLDLIPDSETKLALDALIDFVIRRT